MNNSSRGSTMGAATMSWHPPQAAGYARADQALGPETPDPRTSHPPAGARQSQGPKPCKQVPGASQYTPELPGSDTTPDYIRQ